MQLSVNTTTRVIEQVGDRLGERTDCTIIEASETTAAALAEALARSFDGLVLNDDSTITVRYDQATHDAEVEAVQAAETATQAAAVERTAATADLRDQSAADLTRLDEIAAKGTDFDAKQANQALAEQAAVLGRVLRLLKAQGG